MIDRVDGFSGVTAAHRAAFGQEIAGGVSPGEGESTFAETLQRALGDVSEMQEGAQDAMSAFLAGEPIEIHEVMAAAEEAGIALEMLIEIRNKLTEAYRTVAQMQQ